MFCYAERFNLDRERPTGWLSVFAISGAHAKPRPGSRLTLRLLPRPGRGHSSPTTSSSRERPKGAPTPHAPAPADRSAHPSRACLRVRGVRGARRTGRENLEATGGRSQRLPGGTAPALPPRPHVGHELRAPPHREAPAPHQWAPRCEWPRPPPLARQWSQGLGAPAAGF